MAAPGVTRDGRPELARPNPDPTGLDLLPQQGRMRLVDTILEWADQRICVAGTVTERWPTAEDGTIHAVMLIELVAQGAALLGTRVMADNEGKLALLVGVPEAVLD